MVKYKIEWKKSAVKELKKINYRYVSQLLAAVRSLSQNPYPKGGRKLKGSKYIYRIRVSNYRVIYEIDNNRVTIFILRVRHRKDVYK